MRFLSADEEAALRDALVKREQRMREARTNHNVWLAERDKPTLPDLPADYVDHVRPQVLLALNCGLRRGELFSLRWSEVNLRDRELTVLGTSAKTGQTRVVPLNAEAVSILTALSERGASGLVFPGPTGERMTNINKSWASIVEAAGLENFHFHDCRHHFASRLVQANVSLNVVRELLGHTAITMTLRYAHNDRTSLAAAVEQVAR